MDKKPENSKEKYGDVMSHSFGEGYATRSDEEGFGGTYGGNQSFQKHKDEVHENHPDYDKTQGSEAKEKERGRNQT
ncbi:BnaA07g37400D [Brassica napus]|uniref:BnaA07g37400D protein n=5 Tax=Brassica TaxID=3705 RepID=A0A078IS16_BRANA|nr:BnaA07g37400D [Brassica napus]